MLKESETSQQRLGQVSTDACWRWLAGTLVLAPLLVISILVAAHPEKRTVTTLYHDSVVRWAARQPLYDGPSGMNYLPTFVPIFAPFHFPPRAVGDVAWRWVAWGGLVCGIWQFTRQGARPQRSFALAALLGLPLCLDAIRNGQANAHLGAALLLGAVCLARGRWWPAVIFVCLSVAIKPLGLAAIGLVFAAYPRLWWRLGVGLTGTLLLPFLCGPFNYVRSQFAAEFTNLRQCAVVTENRFADLNGLLRAVGAPLEGTPSLLVRGAAGLALAVFCWLIVRRLPERERALGWLACAAGYLMLFNPMTEANSYVALGPAMAVWSRSLFASGCPIRGWVLAGAALTMGLLPELLRHGFGNSFALAWFPLMAIVFLCVVASWLWNQSARA